MATLGVDGFQEVGTITSDASCCTQDLCSIDPNALACNFVNLLPSGPIWDAQKQAAMQYYEDRKDCEGPGSCPGLDMDCTPFVMHSVYSAFRLYDGLTKALWPALRESDPRTACTTLDDWLDRLGWHDCFRGACRDPRLGPLTPYEIPTACGPVFCTNAGAPDPLECAVKHAIILALYRARLGIIKNVNGINWVIEPLGASIAVSTDPGIPCPLVVTINKTRDDIEVCDCVTCPPTYPRPAPIPAWYTPACDAPAGLPQKIWPGLLAAECIVRSYLARQGVNGGTIFRRVCE